MRPTRIIETYFTVTRTICGFSFFCLSRICSFFTTRIASRKICYPWTKGDISIFAAWYTQRARIHTSRKQEFCCRTQAREVVWYITKDVDFLLFFSSCTIQQPCIARGRERNSGCHCYLSTLILRRILFAVSLFFSRDKIPRVTCLLGFLRI